MLFNSLQFFVFFTIVYGLYRIGTHRFQNRMLLLASYFFYGCWDWRFLSLIWISTLVDYTCGLRLDALEDNSRRRFWLWLSVLTNLGILGFFKYFNFFSSSLQSLLGWFGWQADPVTLHIVLPVGISFYTFQTMSYTIDVYRREIKAEKKLPDFALFVAFFPQLVAGPIERAKELLPQISRPRTVSGNQMNEGGWLILRGLFKKVFVADNLAHIADYYFNGAANAPALGMLAGVYAFAFQIYGDFSGYSDIARGLSKLMGIEIQLNFKFPYFVTNPRDFWKNWHISLSTWLRDYLYIPLGGNRGNAFQLFRNLMVTMLLGGLWHGASWTFVLWGAYHGLLLYLQRIYERARKGGPAKALLSTFLKRAAMFQLTCFGWILFRAGNVSKLSDVLHALISGWALPSGQTALSWIQIFQTVWLLLALETVQKLNKTTLVIFKFPAWGRTFIYILMFYYIILFGGHAQEFIYFQF